MAPAPATHTHTYTDTHTLKQITLFEISPELTKLSACFLLRLLSYQTHPFFLFFGWFSDKLLSELCWWSSLWIPRWEDNKGGKQSRKRKRRHSTTAPAELQQGRAYWLWFLVRKGRGARRTQVCMVISLFLSFFFFYFLCLRSAWILYRRLLSIFQGDCMCYLCVSRNGLSEGSPSAFDIPLCSGSVCRYHTYASVQLLRLFLYH